MDQTVALGFSLLVGWGCQLEWCEGAFQQAAACATSLGADCINQLALVLDRAVEKRRYASYRPGRVRIRARYFCHPQMARDLEREHIFVLAARTVEHFDRVDELEDFEPGRTLRVGRI